MISKVWLRFFVFLTLWLGLVGLTLTSLATVPYDGQLPISIAYDIRANHVISWFGGAEIQSASENHREFAVPNALLAELPKLLAANTIDSSLVRFSQDSISGTFSDGSSVADLASGLQNGTISSSDIPPIRLVNNDGQLFTLDNRRLAAFQQAGIPIPYQMATPGEAAANAWKFTTQNGGTSIRIRGQ